MHPIIHDQPLEQSRNPRLFAAIVCQYRTTSLPNKRNPVTKQSTQDMLNETKQWHPGESLLIMAPIVHKKKGEFHNVFDELKQQGFVRVRVNGDIKRLDECTRLQKHKQHTIELIIDRIRNEDSQSGRLFEAIELATKQANGLVRIEHAVNGEHITLSEHFASDHYQFNISELTSDCFHLTLPLGHAQHAMDWGILWRLIPTSYFLPTIPFKTLARPCQF